MRFSDAAIEADFAKYASTVCKGCGHRRVDHTDGGIDHGLFNRMPCLVSDPDVLDFERLVPCLCLGFWEPGEPCPYDMASTEEDTE